MASTRPAFHLVGRFAVLDREGGPLLGPVPVEELEEHATGLVLDLVLHLLARDVFVREALAVLVQV